MKGIISLKVLFVFLQKIWDQNELKFALTLTFPRATCDFAYIADRSFPPEPPDEAFPLLPLFWPCVLPT